MKIFNRRFEEIRTQAGKIPPGRLTENNTAVMVMAAKYVRYVLAASATTIVLCWYLMGQLEGGSEAHKSLSTSVTVICFGLLALAIIFGLFRTARWMENRAVALDDRQYSDDQVTPPSREVRRYMGRAIFMIQLGYRLVTFAGICVVIGVIFVIKGLYAM